MKIEDILKPMCHKTLLNVQEFLFDIIFLDLCLFTQKDKKITFHCILITLKILKSSQASFILVDFQNRNVQLGLESFNDSSEILTFHFCIHLGQYSWNLKILLPFASYLISFLPVFPFFLFAFLASFSSLLPVGASVSSICVLSFIKAPTSL